MSLNKDVDKPKRLTLPKTYLTLQGPAFTKATEYSSFELSKVSVLLLHVA